MTRTEQTQRRVTLADLTLVETRFPAHAYLAEHWHRQAFFCLALQGPFHEMTAGRSLERSQHTILFHPPGQTHADRFHAAGGACFNVEFGPAWDDRLDELLPGLSTAGCRQGGMPAWYAERLHDQLRRGEARSALAVEGLALLLLAEACEGGERHDRWHPPQWLDRVRRYLHDTYRNGPTIAEAAAVAGSHPVHVARVFRRAFGCTIGTYVLRLRLDHACRLLTQADRSLTEIALDAGFADQSHFTRALKQTRGVTPGQLRRRSSEC